MVVLTVVKVRFYWPESYVLSPRRQIPDYNNQNYLPRFYTAANLKAVHIIRRACQEAGDISMVEATYRWLLLHSALRAECGDGVLLGASSMVGLAA